MSLSKQQTVGMAAAGVFVAAAGALGWLLWDARSGRLEAEERLEMEQSTLDGFLKAKVFPSQKSIADVKTNEAAYAAWMESALAIAAIGDKKAAAENESPSVFKQRLQAEVRRLADLPGMVNGKLAAEDFRFGFEQYLGEGGVLPGADEVPELAVQLECISRMTDMFAEAGVGAVRGVVRVGKPQEEKADPRKAKKTAKKKAEAEEGRKEIWRDYKFDLLAGPAALAGIFNRITAAKAFVTVEEFGFEKSADTIAAKLSEREQKEEEGGRGGRRGRRRGAAAQVADAPAAPKGEAGVVSDPEGDAPFAVQLTLRVHDFGTAAAGKGE